MPGFWYHFSSILQTINKINMISGITEKPFGSFESKPVTEYTLTNNNGMQVSALNYGATITKIITNDKQGNPGNVLSGFDSFDEYLQNGNQYNGSIVGRYCNRIGNARFELDGKEYVLAKNNKGNSLHGGIKGFDKVCWTVKKKNITNSLIFSYLSTDGEEGFPGNLNVEVVYTLTENNELIIDYSAQTDKACPVNLTSHCYFNLSGETETSILDHLLKINADHYTMLNTDSIPTSEITTVKNDRLDFTIAKNIGKDIHIFPGGYDINYVLNEPGGKAAELYDPASGRLMDVFTSEPGLQLYVGNRTRKTITGSETEETEIKYAAVCLEAQHFPDSPNKPSFPNTILRPGETYIQKTVYQFSVR